MNPSRGLYLVLEGGDASGKSRQAQGLVDWLRAGGMTVRHLREAGSTATGEALRQLLLDPATGDLQQLTEALLFSAARAEML
ncbi:MAG: dTMP kinase, partial [Planctomycetota bacterium]|nr:dTMP kinase [Planctomycetota bacterium]